MNQELQIVIGGRIKESEPSDLQIVTHPFAL